jgi:alkylation response protein AidB-like acyl-CoA dehydrogenase
MDFTFTPEQEALREQAREFLAANPEPTWAQLAELGWTGVSIAEDDGGAGLSFVEGPSSSRSSGARSTTARTSRRSA